MGKKFMIVKPTPCCGNKSSVGIVREFIGKAEAAMQRCVYCGKRTITGDEIKYLHYGDIVTVEESRIIWLPDESDVIEHDENLDITS